MSSMPIPTHDDRPPLSLARESSSGILEEHHYQQLQELTRSGSPDVESCKCPQAQLAVRCFGAAIT